MTDQVRTRIAPSPTGAPHVGTAYMALFNLAYARRHGGRMVFSIEDTDQLRSTPESEDAILQALSWIGTKWDEGPDCGGDYGPYRQSERTSLYQAEVQRLVDEGHAYLCFCTPDRLEQLRKEQIANKETPRYDGHCLSLSPEEAEERKNKGEPYVVRLKIPHEGECRFQDELRGEISIDWSQIDHQVIQKSDGLPTYHLASVVDDHLMKISHVIRGEEWINSTPKHILLYERLGWKPPVFIHLPLLRNPDKSKLSKRKNPTSISYYRDAGFLPEAMLNYLGMMGYTLPDQREMFSLDELCETFEMKRVSLGGPVFGVEKLKWLNGRYLREKMSHEEVLQKLLEWKGGPDFFRKIIPLALPRLETFSDFFPISQFLLNEIPTYQFEDLIGKQESVEVAESSRSRNGNLRKPPPGTEILSRASFRRIAETERRSSRNFLPLSSYASPGARFRSLFSMAWSYLGADLTKSTDQKGASFSPQMKSD